MKNRITLSKALSQVFLIEIQILKQQSVKDQSNAKRSNFSHNISQLLWCNQEGGFNNTGVSGVA